MVEMARCVIRYSPFANCEYTWIMALKSQDVVVCLKLAVWKGDAWTFDSLSSSLSLSASETHSAMLRLRAARLLNASGKRPMRRNLIEFLTCGLKYIWPAQLEGPVSGIPTAYAASPLRELLIEMDASLPVPVWPYAQGTHYGFELTPLYRTVPHAALRDPELYELVALCDALRLHQARISQLAEELLRERLSVLSTIWDSLSYA